MDTLITILFIVSIIGCVGDSLSTYLFLKKGVGEKNLLADKVFKLLGIEFGSIVLFLGTVYYCWYVYTVDIEFYFKLIFLGLFAMLKIGATIHNTTSKKIWIIQALIFLVPIYWDFEAVGKKLLKVKNYFKF